MATTPETETLVDANVLIDVLTADPTWGGRSEELLAAAMRSGTIGINPIVYAELAPAYSSGEALDRVLTEMAAGAPLQRWPLPWPAAYRAGRAFLRYRREHGGVKRSPLPDFFIGAHAEIDNLTLLTRDAARYRTYFPEVELISP